MPEGPEVKTFVSQLQRYSGLRLDSVDIHASSRFSKEKLEECLPLFPLTNVQFHCKGKFIYCIFDEDVVFFITLGMTGSFKTEKGKHAALSFNFGNNTIHLDDPRHFATFKVKTKSDLQTKLDSLGWDPFSNENPDFIYSRLEKSKKTVAECLLDQSLFCGLGNYIRSEVLYECQIHPNKLSKELSVEEIDSIINSFRNISKLSYKHGGSTLSTYSDMNGNVGNFSDFLKVYKKKTDSFGNKIEKIIANDGRSVYFARRGQHEKI